MTQTERTQMVIIGGIQCEKIEFNGEILISSTDVVGNDKKYKINPTKGFKSEAEQILWTMVNNEIARNDKPTYEEAIEQKLDKTCKICGNSKLIGDFNRNKLGKYGARPECKVCQ